VSIDGRPGRRPKIASPPSSRAPTGTPRPGSQSASQSSWPRKGFVYPGAYLRRLPLIPPVKSRSTGGRATLPHRDSDAAARIDANLPGWIGLEFGTAQDRGDVCGVRTRSTIATPGAGSIRTCRSRGVDRKHGWRDQSRPESRTGRWPRPRNQPRCPDGNRDVSCGPTPGVNDVGGLDFGNQMGGSGCSRDGRWASRCSSTSRRRTARSTRLTPRPIRFVGTEPDSTQSGNASGPPSLRSRARRGASSAGAATE